MNKHDRLVDVVDRVLSGDITQVQLRYWLGTLEISAEDFSQICKIRAEVLAKHYAEEKVNTVFRFIGLVIFCLAWLYSLTILLS
jgi:hypothetical protein